LDPVTVSSIAPHARSILAYSRTTGDALELVPSSSTPGLFHLVDPINRTCDCKGWAYRHQCRHLSPTAPSRPLADGGQAHLATMRAAGDWPKVSPEVAAKAALAFEIWGDE
jgi:hypothetical protein